MGSSLDKICTKRTEIWESYKKIGIAFSFLDWTISKGKHYYNFFLNIKVKIYNTLLINNEFFSRRITPQTPCYFLMFYWYRWLHNDGWIMNFPMTILVKICILLFHMTRSMDCNTSTENTNAASIDLPPAAESNRYIKTMMLITSLKLKTKSEASSSKKASPNQGFISSDNMSKSQWMTQSAPLLKDLRLGEVLIPGTHNSGSFSITSTNAQLVNTFLPVRLAFAFAKVSYAR